ncbi:hypothetical protein [Massilia niastensis]|uniref:hypothetical protein n=1 Tax=Massilia niastensis TaxID=544911 RepID=UPI00037A70F7|nr:hypothetical protein [Massilia niastensis]
MKKLILTVVGAAVTSMAPIAAHAQFNFTKIFGGTRANHGSVLPEWWNETEYNPPVQDNAMHIRVGSAGASGDRYGQSGRLNCDWAYLYAAKANAPLDAREREECALLEFHIKRGIDGDQRNHADGFVRQEILAEMGRKIDARIEQLRSANLFYFRSSAIKVEAYDMTMRSAPIKVNWHSTSTDSATYVVRGRGFSDDSGWMQVPLMADEGLARQVEAARFNNNNSYLALAHNRIVFEILGVKQVNKGSRPTRAIDVLFREVSFRLMDSQGRANRIAIENTQATPR